MAQSKEKTPNAKESPVLKVTTPWFNDKEWDSVFEEIYSDDFQQQKHATGRIAAWKCRFGHRLPVAVGLTGELTEAMIVTQEMTPNEQYNRRLAHGLALIRFVNLLTDQKQTEKFARPVYQMAEELGIPEWMVELRHDATHSDMPSLPMMLTGTKVALEWLKRNYWQAQIEKREGPILNDEEANESQDTDSISVDEESIIDVFIPPRLRFLNMNKKLRSANVKLNEELQHIEDYFREMPQETAVDEFVEKGLLNGDVIAGLHIDITNMDIYEKPMPSILLTFWKPLIAIIQEAEAIPYLIETLLERKAEVGSLEEHLQAYWIHVFIGCLGVSNGQRRITKTVLKDIFPDVVRIHKKVLYKKLLEHPTQYSAFLLPDLMPPACTRGLVIPVEDASTLINCYCPSMHDDTSYGENKIYTLKDVEDLTEEEVMDVTEDVSWHKYPLGTFPGMRADNFARLELSEEETDAHVPIDLLMVDFGASESNWAGISRSKISKIKEELSVF